MTAYILKNGACKYPKEMSLDELYETLTFIDNSLKNCDTYMRGHYVGSKGYIKRLIKEKGE